MFDLHATADGSRARRGTLTTAHAVIETPVFMPVGTRGTVRTQSHADMEKLGARIVLANTYHLLLKPGPEVLEHMAEGRSNRGIADRLVVTEKTVETHVASILGKLGLEAEPDDHRRVLAVLAYLRAG